MIIYFDNMKGGRIDFSGTRSDMNVMHGVLTFCRSRAEDPEAIAIYDKYINLIEQELERETE